MSDIDVALVVAVAKNGIIGADNDMPWRLSTDLKRFKNITFGKPIIMGRRTFQSIGKPLPGRLNVVVSRQAGLMIEGVQVVSTLEAALAIARQQAEKDNVSEIMIVGGGKVYADMIDRADRLYVTHVDASPEGDTSFPPINETIWSVVDEETVPAGERDSAATRFVIYERKSDE